MAHDHKKPLKTWVREKELIELIPAIGSLSRLRNDRSTRLLGIPYAKLGRNVLYCVEDVQAFLESKVIQSNEVE